MIEKIFKSNKVVVAFLNVVTAFVFFMYFTIPTIFWSALSEIFDVVLGEGAHANHHFRRYNHTALLFAVNRGYLRMVNILLKLGVDVNYGHEFDETPLIVALGRGDLLIIQALLVAGANVNHIKEDGSSILLDALNGPIETVEILLNNGANADDVNYIRPANRWNIFAPPEGKTPLLVAIRAGDVDKAMLLLKKGTNINYVNSAGYDARAAALHSGNPKMIIFVEKHLNLSKIAVLASVGSLNHYRTLKQRKKNELYVSDPVPAISKLHGRYTGYDLLADMLGPKPGF